MLDLIQDESPFEQPMFDLSDPPQLKVAAWREQQLTKNGVGLLDARLIAVRRDIDIAVCVRMLTGGCTPTQLKEIVL